MEWHGRSENLRTVAEVCDFEGRVVNSGAGEASDHLVQKSVPDRSCDAHFHARK